MAQIFKEAQGFDNHPNRWNHDLSHKIYGSFKAGRLYPVLTHLVKPTDSIELDIAALLQFMPTPTPLQSNVRVIFHAFYQRLKNIHEDFPNFIEMLEDHDVPYIRPHVDEFFAGSIHDYLDVPCNVVVNGRRSLLLRSQVGVSSDQTIVMYNNNFINPHYYIDGLTVTSSLQSGCGFGVFFDPIRVLPSSGSSVFGDDDSVIFSFDKYPFNFHYVDSSDLLMFPEVRLGFQFADSLQGFSSGEFPHFIRSGAFSPSRDDSPYDVYFRRSELIDALREAGYKEGQYIRFCVGFFSGVNVFLSPVVISSAGSPVRFDRIVKSVVPCSLDFYVYGSYSYADFPELCPYQTVEYPDRPIRLNAYRYRVYESNYNAFYRNIHGNQPFVINGVTQYNKYNTTKVSGLDETRYDFFNRNWELDAYTSCLPSPQQGNPPLVGVSSTGRLTITSDDGSVSTAQLQDLPDGAQGLSISQVNAANDEHRRLMIDLASSGISINDLRETNALQKFLETNIRKGFRYIDFIKGHFGKAPKHAEMDMPEFLGGFAVKLDVGKVTNTNQAAVAVDQDAVLGQFAGSAQAFGSSKHSIRYFADDFGYVQVLMCVVPDSAYSQVLPKDYLYREALDFPFPEFGNLSYQPITYEEFCPGEAFKDMIEDPQKLITDVFGYQRPQHECVWLPDRLHGQFLTTMNNYCVNRVFEHRPELGDEFLQIKPEDMQRNFTVLKGDDDIAFGQVGFKFTVKQAVPRIAIPSIGR